MALLRAIFGNFKLQAQNVWFPISSEKFPLILIMGIQFCTRTMSPSSLSSLANHLKNQRLDQARIIFNKIPSPGAHLYTMMISGYAKNDRLKEALIMFDLMPNKDVIAWNSMIQGCLDCGDLATAKRLFEKMPERNVVSWTTMLSGYLKFGGFDAAERLFWAMPVRDVVAWNAMIYGYCGHGRVEEGMKLFQQMPCRNVISWTSIIGGLDQNKMSEEALFLFGKMVDSGVEPTSNTFACVLSACGKVIDLNLGVQIHGHLVQSGYCFDDFISASLITFYADCNIVENSYKVFNETLSRNVVIWTALLTGYVSNLMHEDALKIFGNMIKIGVFPNQSTFSSTLNACCKLGALDEGKMIHSVATKLGLETDVFVGNSLVVMYSECGNVNNASTAFKIINNKNVVSWNSMIVGSAQHGYGMWALIFFKQMICAGLDPDEITFTGLLAACSHSGLLQKGRCFFEYIRRYKPTALKLQHYACMADILGRCGKLEEAEELVKNMPMRANSMIWLALLSACRVHCDLEIAERAAQKIIELEPQCSAAYVLLSNLYASAGRWADVSRVRVKMRHGGAMKQPGSSWVILKGMRHEFLSGDRSHPLSKTIYEKLVWLGGKLKEFGYIPDHSFALHDVEVEQKEEMLLYHSERLAIAFALVSTVEGSTITVLKNLRVCGDCHSAIKLISKIVGREIVVRDSGRFHSFKNGICSCKDYW